MESVEAIDELSKRDRSHTLFSPLCVKNQKAAMTKNDAATVTSTSHHDGSKKSIAVSVIIDDVCVFRLQIVNCIIIIIIIILRRKYVYMYVYVYVYSDGLVCGVMVIIVMKKVILKRKSEEENDD